MTFDNLDDYELDVIKKIRSFSPEGQRLMYEYTEKAIAAEASGEGFGSVIWEPYLERILEANRAYKLAAIHAEANTSLPNDIPPLRDQ